MTFSHRQLHAFLSVADMGSIGRATHVVNLTQSALSRMIHELEKQCKVDLFERHPLGMRLTEAGNTLVPYARSVMFEMERAEEALSVMRGTSQGVVRVGAIAGVGRQLLPSTVRKLLDNRTDIQLHVLEATGGELAMALANGSIDIFIGHDNLDGDEVTKVRSTNYLDCCRAVCSSKHPFAKRDRVSVGEVLDAEWVLPRPDSTPRKLLQELVIRSHCKMPSAVVETVSPNAVVAFIRHSNLIGWLPQSLYLDEAEAGLILPINVPELEMHRPYFIYKRKRNILSPSAAKVMEALCAL